MDLLKYLNPSSLFHRQWDNCLIFTFHGMNWKNIYGSPYWFIPVYRCLKWPSLSSPLVTDSIIWLDRVRVTATSWLVMMWVGYCKLETPLDKLWLWLRYGFCVHIILEWWVIQSYSNLLLSVIHTINEDRWFEKRRKIAIKLSTR